jgi:hypothetical protein
MTSMQRRKLLGAGLAALALLPVGSLPTPAQNLPVFRSPIDIAGTFLQLRVSAPDRNTQQRVDVRLPAGSIPHEASEYFKTTLGSQVDEQWNTKPNKELGNKTPRQAVCDRLQAKVTELNHQMPNDKQLIVQCNLASRGQLLAQRDGAIMYLAYQLTNNSVTVRLTTPGTCRPGESIVCPDDPQVTVTFALQVVTYVRTPSLCEMRATDAVASANSISFRGDTTAGSVGLSLVRLLFPNSAFPMIEDVLKSVHHDVPLPIEKFFSAIRNSPACNNHVPAATLALRAFGNLETEIDLRNRALIFRASHPGIRPPQVGVPNPTGPDVPSPVPMFGRPEISVSQPQVQAGNSLQIRGQAFPPGTKLSDSFPITFLHEGYANNSSLPVCAGGGVTELRWVALGGGQPYLVRISATADRKCPPSFDLKHLTPNTTYQMIARDCDLITCSRWSAAIRRTTAKADANPGQVVITLDGGGAGHVWRPRPGRPGASPQRWLGTATADANGAFAVSVMIPKETTAGQHTIHAVSGGVKASETIQVATANPTPGTVRAKLMMIARLGQTGCPNNPIQSTSAEYPFVLFGSGFAPGIVTIRVDRATGHEVGTVKVQGDGSFCEEMKSVPLALVGRRTLVAIQNNAIAAQLPTQFVRRSVVR